MFCALPDPSDRRLGEVGAPYPIPNAVILFSYLPSNFEPHHLAFEITGYVAITCLDANPTNLIFLAA